MRRTLALLALLATSWPHVVVLECALGAPPSAEPGRHHGAAETGSGGSVHHGVAHHGTGHDHGPRQHARSDAGAAGGLPCAMVMTCGLVMIHSRSAPAVAEVRSGPEDRRLPSLEAPVAAELAAETPPPRRSA